MLAVTAVTSDVVALPPPGATPTTSPTATAPAGMSVGAPPGAPARTTGTRCPGVRVTPTPAAVDRVTTPATAAASRCDHATTRANVGSRPPPPAVTSSSSPVVTTAIGTTPRLRDTTAAVAGKQLPRAPLTRSRGAAVGVGDPGARAPEEWVGVGDGVGVAVRTADGDGNGFCDGVGDGVGDGRNLLAAAAAAAAAAFALRCASDSVSSTPSTALVGRLSWSLDMSLSFGGRAATDGCGVTTATAGKHTVGAMPIKNLGLSSSTARARRSAALGDLERARASAADRGGRGMARPAPGGAPATAADGRLADADVAAVADGCAATSALLPRGDAVCDDAVGRGDVVSRGDAVGRGVALVVAAADTFSTTTVGRGVAIVRGFAVARGDAVARSVAVGRDAAPVVTRTNVGSSTASALTALVAGRRR